MNQRSLLYLLLSFFVVIAVVVGWAVVFESTAFFKAGTRPEIAASEGAKPSLPPVRPTDPARGSSEEGAVTIVEFADYTCLYCRAVESELTQVLAQNPNARHVWRDLPIASDRPDAMLATLAGRCAKEQGKFWEMHDELLRADAVDLNSLRDIARKLQLNENTFSECLASNRYLNEVQQDIDIAREHNLKSAPTFFIGNQVIEGYATAGEFRWALLRAQWQN